MYTGSWHGNWLKVKSNRSLDVVLVALASVVVVVVVVVTSVVDTLMLLLLMFQLLMMNLRSGPQRNTEMAGDGISTLCIQ